jgi:hypothetical protein
VNYNDIEYVAINYEVFNEKVDKKYPIQIQAEANFNNDQLTEFIKGESKSSNFGTLILDAEHLKRFCKEVDDDNDGDEDEEDSEDDSGDDEIDPEDDYGSGEYQLCYIHIQVTSPKMVALNYRLSVVQNSEPFMLADGKYAKLPSPKNLPVKMQYAVKNRQNDVSLSIYTDYKQLKVSVKVFDGMVFGFIDEIKPRFATAVQNAGLIEVKIPKSNFVDSSYPLI